MHIQDAETQRHGARAYTRAAGWSNVAPIYSEARSGNNTVAKTQAGWCVGQVPRLGYAAIEKRAAHVRARAKTPAPVHVFNSPHSPRNGTHVPNTTHTRAVHAYYRIEIRVKSL